MTLNEAFTELINSDEFKNIAKKKDGIGGKYRSYLSRFNRGLLKTGALAEILVANGYEVSAKKAVKKKK